MITTIYQKHSIHAGDRAPYGQLTNDSSLFDLIRGVGHHIFLFEGQIGHIDLDAVERQLQKALEPYTLVVNTHHIHKQHQKLHDTYNVVHPTLFLIRPDGHIGYRGEIDLCHDERGHISTTNDFVHEINQGLAMLRNLMHLTFNVLKLSARYRLPLHKPIDLFTATESLNIVTIPRFLQPNADRFDEQFLFLGQSIRQVHQPHDFP